ncbi:protein translocase subunit SecD [Paenibacillus larvae]|uniref:Protein translocase subunit SecD n=3 Tax=Paenibacillus larvae TaxID=1464 RepID=V9W6C2_9BACL|nr:protein translocase subunit SecD [Paenibacillus larvae]AHD06576.1 protein translocase subunit SecDF [Paenibacillus larvae subsp. larvae DSM 25430]AVF21360.1 protein translocase subunit SecDF [Paenibacillus larvae subsp. larvae]AVG13134.1 protein translocase subunit SecDF [Paenibacillus larvae subsp. larvae DSM 25430]ETK30148.1 protein translocase subunit SecDF [Paenibacillus larvae subsp. larvae DSM 25719]MCY7477180.1 protein translocase subunit SecD [Paenibacillus larvae]
MDWKRISIFFMTILVTLAIVLWTSPNLVKQIRLGLDLKGGFEILYVASPLEEGKPVTKESLKETAKSLEKRADAIGIAEPEITTEGNDRIRVRLAGVENEEQVREIIKKPADLTFRGPDGTVELNGSDFVENGAAVGFDNLNKPMVQVKVKDKDKLKKVTEKLLQKPLAIYLDDKQLSAPVVQSVISEGTATISGNYTVQEANELRDTINLGAMPLKLTEKYTQSVGATLGQQSMKQTVEAGIIGATVILLFMVLYYRVPGLIAAFTLISYIWLMLLVFNLIHATLTLPGIAALVLGIGMAVDANIITYERIKEEIRSGKSILSSVKAGSKHSLRTIMDANITNLIAGIVLYYIGNGAIRGFALTHMLSIGVSILTNVVLSRFLLHLLIRGKLAKKPSYFGVKEAEIREL